MAMADQPCRGTCCNWCIAGLVALGSLGYSTYLMWLLAHLQANNYYYFLLVIPLFFIRLFLWIAECKKTINHNESIAFSVSSALVTSMCCFTMLTRFAYYHLDPQDTYGPRFVILLLKGPIILILAAFFAQREFKVARILEDKDLLNRAVLDFVDIFDLVELLSLNECVGVGSFVSENSHTERAIQAFCVISFPISYAIFFDAIESELGRTGWIMYLVHLYSALCQNFPFLVIRIVVWVQYNVHSLGFLMKNVTSIAISLAHVVNAHRSRKMHELDSLTRPAFTENPFPPISL